MFTQMPYQTRPFKFNGSKFAKLEVVSYHTGWENTCECCLKESNISTESYIVDGEKGREHLNLCHVCFTKLLVKVMPNTFQVSLEEAKAIKAHVIEYLRIR